MHGATVRFIVEEPFIRQSSRFTQKMKAAGSPKRRQYSPYHKSLPPNNSIVRVVVIKRRKSLLLHQSHTTGQHVGTNRVLETSFSPPVLIIIARLEFLTA